MRGGARKGAGRKPLPEEEKRKVRSFRLNDAEWKTMQTMQHMLVKRQSFSATFSPDSQSYIVRALTAGEIRQFPFSKGDVTHDS